jgi:SAM-dependent methyltransferase
MSDPTSRWSNAPGVLRGAAYDERWARMEAAGLSIHGEADFVGRFEPASALDAGCGTGRVAIELARRGVDVVGVDLDPPMIAAARAKAPELTWVEADLCGVVLDRTFDVVVAPGNVMIFLRPGTEGACVANLASHLAPEGVLVAGFQLDHTYGLAEYDADCAAAGLDFVERYATWDCDEFAPGGGYAVSVHRRA